MERWVREPLPFSIAISALWLSYISGYRSKRSH